MTRLSMSDVIQAQEARIDSLTLMVERLTAMHGEALAALTDRRQAAETVVLKRIGTGDKPTAVEVAVVVQPSETVEAAYERAAQVYERAAARYPLPSGYAHAHALGPENGNGDGPP